MDTPHTADPSHCILEAVFRAHHRAFVAYAQRHGAAEPEETVQDAYCRMLPHADRFQAENFRDEETRRFLYAVVRNLTTDQYRRSSRITITPTDDIPEPHSYEHDTETDLLVRDYMDEARRSEGVVLDMIGDGYNDSEIARKLNVTRDHVRRIKGVARTQLTVPLGLTGRSNTYCSFG